MADSNPQFKLTIQGRKLDVSQAGDIVTGKGADIVQATPRAGMAIEVGRTQSQDIEALTISDKNDVVEVMLEDDLVLYTSIQRLREDIIPTDKQGATRGEMLLPSRLSFTNRRSRGIDDILIKSVKVLDLKGKLLEVAAEKTGEFPARKIAEKIEEQLVGPDILYRIVANGLSGKEAMTMKPATGEDIDTAGPRLLFIHGTASSTEGSFSELWNPSESTGDTVWEDLEQTYTKNIPTLSNRKKIRSREWSLVKTNS